MASWKGLANENDRENVVLKTTDNESFKVDKAVVMRCELIKTMLENQNDDTMSVLPLEIEAPILRHVLRWLKCLYEVEQIIARCDGPEERSRYLKSMTKWEKDFFTMDQPMVFKIWLAANYLNESTLCGAAYSFMSSSNGVEKVEEMRVEDLVAEELAKQSSSNGVEKVEQMRVEDLVAEELAKQSSSNGVEKVEQMRVEDLVAEELGK